MRPRHPALAAGAVLALGGALALAILFGPSALAPDAVLAALTTPPWQAAFADSGPGAIVWLIRLPRALVALLVGAILATAGACYQALFRNPLADPYLIGVASGAGLGAALALMVPAAAVPLGIPLVTPMAFVGAVCAVFLAYRLAHVEGIALPTTLILAGVALSYIGTAGMSLLFLIDGQRFLTVFGWLLGGFNGAGWIQVATVAAYGLPALGLIHLHARALNVLQLDDEQATQLGVHVASVRSRLILAASLGTAAAVSVAGLVGFVGLMVPHAVRRLTGADARVLLPASALVGAIFMLLADLTSRTLTVPAGIPVGIITTLLGAPFFLVLLRRRTLLE
jgi:iron complex transport system permease protein